MSWLLSLRSLCRGSHLLQRQLPATCSLGTTLTHNSTSPLLSSVARTFSVVSLPWISSRQQSLPASQRIDTGLLQTSTVSWMQTCSYKSKLHLKKRCPRCYFVKRRGRLFVECKEKPRHKQMQKLHKFQVFNED